MQLHCDHSYR